jgi:hypothetical protein
MRLITFDAQLLLPLVELIAAYPQFQRQLRRRFLPHIQQPDRFQLEFPAKSLSPPIRIDLRPLLAHVTSPSVL